MQCAPGAISFDEDDRTEFFEELREALSVAAATRDAAPAAGRAGKSFDPSLTGPQPEIHARPAAAC